MFNTSDSVPRSGEGGSAQANLAKKVKAHIKLLRTRHGLKPLHQLSSKLDEIIRLERPHR